MSYLSEFVQVEDLKHGDIISPILVGGVQSLYTFYSAEKLGCFNEGEGFVHSGWILNVGSPFGHGLEQIRVLLWTKVERISKILNLAEPAIAAAK